MKIDKANNPPPTAVAFTKLNGFWYWQLRNGRYQSCPDWRHWLKVFGGECQLEQAVDMEREPGEAEFVEAMGWI